MKTDPSNCRGPLVYRLVHWVTAILFLPMPLSADDLQTVATRDIPAKTTISDASDIATAFSNASDGYSSDEVLINDKLRRQFLNALRPGDWSPIDERNVLLQLLRLRKAGKLTQRSTKRGPMPDSSLAPVAEIAARAVTDRHRVTIDTMMADPRLRSELQSEANKILVNADAYSIRKLVLQLRKKRALKPELVLRVADWNRKIETMSLDELRSRLDSKTVPAQPGVYLFRCPKGYLYIGEAKRLSDRLAQHLDESDRPSLATYLESASASSVSIELHVFPNDSPAAKVTVRRAYESELIRSRDPRFNTRP